MSYLDPPVAETKVHPSWVVCTYLLLDNNNGSRFTAVLLVVRSHPTCVWYPQIVLRTDRTALPFFPCIQ